MSAPKFHRKNNSSFYRKSWALLGIALACGVTLKLGAQPLPSEQERERLIRLYEAKVEQQPKLVGSWHELAGLYIEAKRWDDAIRAETKAIAGHPSYAYAYHGRGKAQMGKKNFKAAREDLSRAIELWESRHGREHFLKIEYAKSEHIDSYRSRGMAWGHEGDWNRAIGDLDIAVRLAKENPMLYYEKAYLEEKASKTAEAVDDYFRAARLFVDAGNKTKADECMVKLKELGAAHKLQELTRQIKDKEPVNDLP